MSVPPGAPSGLIKPGADGSPFSTTKLDSPPATTLPPGTEVISSTFTVMLSVGLDDTAKTGRATPARPPTFTSSVVVGGTPCACRNEATPPDGCLAIVSRNALVSVVKFCTTTTKTRWKVWFRRLEFCGENTASPSLMRLL